MSILDVARILKRRMGGLAKRVPTLQMPNWLVRLAALRDPAIRQILPELGKVKNATNEKAKRIQRANIADKQIEGFVGVADSRAAADMQSLVQFLSELLEKSFAASIDHRHRRKSGATRAFESASEKALTG
jgi:hypothetical protein